MMTASQIGQTTGSGKNSFTRCLTQSLRELAAERETSFFSTFDLDERMRKTRPKRTPGLWSRLPRSRLPGSRRHIRFCPLKSREDRPKVDKTLEKPELFLTLGFALKNGNLDEYQIDRLTKRLPQMFKEETVPLTDIKFLGIRKPRLNLRDVVQYCMAQKVNLMTMSLDMARKRTYDDGDESEASPIKNQRLA